MRGTEPAIVVRAVTKKYPLATAVDHLDVDVRSGEIYALLGLNGAGKTTLIRMLLGMVRPTEGTMTVLGHAVAPTATAPWTDVGHLVETPSSYPELTVEENLDLVRRLRRLPEPRSVTDIMARLGLTAYRHQRARELSLGNAQRLGLAKALIHQPRLLVLDEPINGLDPAGVVEIRNLLREQAHERGVTIFLSSHILTEVARLASRIGVIHHGAMVAQLDAASLSTQLHRCLQVSAHDRTAALNVLHQIGHTVDETDPSVLTIHDQTAIERPEDVATALVRAGCPPTRLVVETEDLESYFLRLVEPSGTVS